MAAGMEREGTVSDGRVCEDASAGIYLRFMTRDDTGLIVRRAGAAQGIPQGLCGQQAGHSKL